MKINADFSQRVVLRPGDTPWLASPSPGVERRMLDRIGGEQARATSLVRYAPGSAFPEHGHPAGEEILVLEGVFSDERGDHGPGTYLRNPEGSRHAPRSIGGCTLFVKLRQFAPGDAASVTIDTAHGDWRPGLVPGLRVMPLHSFGTEHTALVDWAPGTVFQPHTHFGGEEILVLRGVFEDEHGAYPAGSWLRSPHLSRHAPFTRDGATILVKVGHLDEERLRPWLGS
ncbi:cupin domain-containing protein [bacterium BD-1]|uniref:cupin domain-containing protein n=1 Tax=Arenimonas sp. TaxID=1872635 RepID=UPI001E641A03|nr:cupin domain-containing protein [Ottowia caeni]